MIDKERQEIINLADIIKGEINRMCVTPKLEEFDSMYSHAQINLNTLASKIFIYKFKKGE